VLLASLGLCLTATIAAPAGGAMPTGLDASLGTAALGDRASVSGAQTILVLNGTSISSRTTVLIDDATGELVVREATEVTSPGDPCTPAAGTPTTEFRCPAGSVGAIVGDLDAGNDSFIAERDVPVLIGAIVGGANRPLRGGTGRDVILGGSAGDALFGAAGRDRLGGREDTDLLNGGPGADRLLGGPAGDVLYGTGGRDRLNGGPGRDLCSGGAGSDRQRGCFITRSVP
jgi:Ca2+-binding RTX toxin-like protein